MATRSTIGRNTVLALVATLGACGEIEPNGQNATTQARAESRRQQTACASSVAYARLKDRVFDQAIEGYRGDRANLDTLADYSTVRMENPVVAGRDAALDLTRCTGRFILEIPPGAERGFGGERRLQADIDYTAQAAADGAGMVYRLSGAEPIVNRLASFNLTSVDFRPPPAIDAPAGAEPVEVARAEVPDAIEPAAPPPRAAPPAPREIAEPRPVPAPRPRPTDRAPAPVREATAPRPPAPAPFERERGRESQRSAGGSGEAAVRAFYGALGAGDGAAASAQVVPDKRSSGAYSPGAISRFYGRLPEPIRLTRIVPVSDDTYRVSYRYSAGRSRCNGSAIVRVTSRGGRDLIRSIRALDGC